MKHTFKKVAAIALAVLMCVTALVPTLAAAETCPGANAVHTQYNCTSYTVVTTQSATCKTNGFTTVACSTCGVKFNINQVEKLDHNWKVVVSDCEEGAKKECVFCGEQKVILAEGPGHNVTKWTLASAAVKECKVGEKVVGVCSVCNETVEYGRIPAEGHFFELVSYVAPVTCAVDGVAKYACVVDGCGATKEEAIKAVETSHNYIAWDTYEGYKVSGNTSLGIVADEDYVKVEDPNKVEATCTTVGTYTKICTTCERTAVVATALKAHDLSDEQAVKAATCDKEGFAAHKYCLDCRAYFAATTTSATGTNLVVKEEDLVLPTLHTVDPLNAATLKVTGVQLPTCTTAGWMFVTCTVEDCDYISKQIALEPVGAHVFYPDVALTDGKAHYDIIADLKAANTTLTGTYTWADLADFTDDTFENIVWKDYKPATCTTDATVTWLCLNCAKAVETVGNATTYTDKIAQCADGKKDVTLTGEDYVKLGHNVLESTVTYMPAAPTCDAGAVAIYKCERYATCGYQETKNLAALGHTYVEIPVEGKEVTCEEAGEVLKVCTRCAKSETIVVESTGTEHKWAYIAGTYKAPNCDVDGSVTRYCNVTGGCATKASPESVVLPKLGHKYIDVASEDIKIELAKLTATNKYLVLTENTNHTVTYSVAATVPSTGKVVAELVTKGDCEHGATYKIYCQNGDIDDPAAPEVTEPACAMFYVHEVSEGFAKGHVKVYVNNTATARSCTAGETSNKWYCKNENCEFTKVETGTQNYGRDTLGANNHQIWNAEKEKAVTVTYKDVPNADVKAAKTFADAAKIEAPVDANGVAKRYEVIEGTTLIWVYAYKPENADHTVTTVEKGGFYCVECGALDTSSAYVIGDKAQTVVKKNIATPHTPVAGTKVDESCLNYGYVPYKCSVAGCFVAEQRDYKKVTTHSFTILVVDENNTVTGTIDRTATANQTILTNAYNKGNYMPEDCTFDGFVIDTCAHCDLVVSVELKATGHYNVTGGVKKPLTSACTDKNANRTCDACQQEIAKVHDYGTGTVCKNCGKTK